MSKNEKMAIVQNWIELNYGNNPLFTIELKDRENIVKGLIQALQIELEVTADGFWSEETTNAFKELLPNGLSKETKIVENNRVKNIIYILRAGFCAAREISVGEMKQSFDEKLENAIKSFQNQTGIVENGIVTAQLFMSILSLNSYELDKDGDEEIREIQQNLNRKYHDKIGVIPTNGIYGTETNTALRKVIEMELGAIENNI